MRIWRRVGDSNSCALAVRQFSGLLGYQLPIPPRTDCWWARRDSNSQTRRKPVSKTGVYPNSTTRPWSTEPDSNWLRAGLQAAASTASEFSAKEKLFS